MVLYVEFLAVLVGDAGAGGRGDERRSSWLSGAESAPLACEDEPSGREQSAASGTQRGGRLRGGGRAIRAVKSST